MTSCIIKLGRNLDFLVVSTLPWPTPIFNQATSQTKLGGGGGGTTTSSLGSGISIWKEMENSPLVTFNFKRFHKLW